MNRILLILLAACSIARAADVTPAQWLAAQPKPVFKSGHSLPVLSMFAWPLPWELNVEFATNWGYALDTTSYDNYLGAGVTNRLNTPTSILAKAVNLATNYPDIFKLAVHVPRWYSNVSVLYWVTNGLGEYVNGAGTGYATPYDINGNPVAIVSPEAPQADLDLQAENLVQPLHAITAAIAPHKPGIIIHGGERGIGVVGQDLAGWNIDSRVAAARGTNWWYYYTSDRKSNELYATYSRLPERDAYIWYYTYEKGRVNQPGYNWEKEWASYGWSSSNLVGAVDLLGTELYYVGLSSWTNSTSGDPATAWSRVTDMLTRNLNQVGYNLRLGIPTNYPFVSGGWSLVSTNRFSSIPRYTGFLKCVYTAGAIGVNAGYYENPTGTEPSIFGNGGFAGEFPEDSPPHWLEQFAAAGRVHAQFSHLEDYIWNGDLLEGNGQSTASPYNVHAIARDQPSYEFTNTVADATARVLARKHDDRDEWLVTAWAAYGNARDVTVTIPTLGEITVTAHPEANIYKATVATGPQLLDVLGQYVGRKVGRADKLRVRRD